MHGIRREQELLKRHGAQGWLHVVLGERAYGGVHLTADSNRNIADVRIDDPAVAEFEGLLHSR